METFSALLVLCAGNSPVHRWIPPTRASEAGFWCFLWSAPWINGWVNNREAGDLRHHRAHYDVIVMIGLIPMRGKQLVTGPSAQWDENQHWTITAISVPQNLHGMELSSVVPSWSNKSHQIPKSKCFLICIFTQLSSLNPLNPGVIFITSLIKIDTTITMTS